MRGRADRRTSVPVALLAVLAAPLLVLAGPPLPGGGPAEARAQAPAGADTLEIDTPYRWIQRSFRVGAFGGWVSADRGVSELGPGSTVIAGARTRARISSPISLEASVGYGSSDRFVVDPRLPGGPATVDTVSSRWLLAEAAMQFAVTGARTWHGIQPYVLVGGGLLIGVDEPRSPRLPTPDPGDPPVRAEIGVAPVVQAGVGVEWKLSERIGIGFEVRDHLWRVSTPDGFFEQEVLDRIEDLDLEAPQDTDWTHNLGLTVSVWRYF